MFIVRNSYKLSRYITVEHFDKMGRLLFLVSIVYFYFNLNEYLVPAYKMKTFEARHLMELFVGEHAFMFWSVQLLGLVIPMILLLFKSMRKPVPMFIIAIVVLIAAWFKRLLIVVPTMEAPFCQTKCAGCLDAPSSYYCGVSYNRWNHHHNRDDNFRSDKLFPVILSEIAEEGHRINSLLNN